MHLAPGKLPYDRLERLLQLNKIEDTRVVIGPRPGEDSAVIEFDNKLLVVKTDPITFTSEHIGYYLVHINANDIAVMGAEPRWLLVTALLPPVTTSEEMLENLLAELRQTCQQLSVSLVGGHTEVTPSVNKPILIGEMIGEATLKTLVDKRSICPGDLILMTKGLAIEGTSIIAREKYQELSKELSDDLLARAKQFLFDPGISIVKEARIAVQYGNVHGMHDPTEGGLLGGVFELVRGLNLGVELYESKIPIFPETIEFCRYFGLDPLKLLASGALLVVAQPEVIIGLQLRFIQDGIGCAIIGKIVENHEQIRLRRLTGWDNLEPVATDEIVKVL